MKRTYKNSILAEGPNGGICEFFAIEFSDGFWGRVVYYRDGAMVETFHCGSGKGYRTERGAKNALMREAVKRGCKIIEE